MIRELHERLQSGKMKSVDLVRLHLEYIRKEDEKLDAFLSIRTEQALEKAQEIDDRFQKGESLGMLAGIPFAAKDNLCVEGETVTAGSKMLEHYTAPYTATVLHRLMDEGAVLIGKTNMDEFAMGSSTESSAFKQTKNPHDTARVPGGSSGGSAVAVASGMVTWALGSDTGGSIRQPASFCDVVGLKPTYGRVSRYGLLAMASSLDQIGCFTTNIEDCAYILSAISGEDINDATSAQSAGKKYEAYLKTDISKKKIGVIKEWIEHKGLDSRIKEKIEATIKTYEDLGAKIEYVSMPMLEYAIPAYYVIVPAEVSSNMARYDGIRFGGEGEGAKNILETYTKTRSQYLGDEVKRRIMLGTYTLSAGYYDAYYKKAQKVRSLIRDEFRKVFDRVDALLGPTSPEVAFRFGEKVDDPLSMYLSDIYTVTANIAGVPAISFPIGLVEQDGKMLPVGGQLMTKWFDEENLLAIAYAYERSKQ
jgi:aspartyl-tRNA(Asn)/glutamyl-tRNA(Gln) amidotransferase subunit A